MIAQDPPLTPEEYLRRLSGQRPGNTAEAPLSLGRDNPPSTAAVAGRQDDPPSSLSRLYRAARAAGRGVARAWNETAQTAADLAPMLNPYPRSSDIGPFERAAQRAADAVTLPIGQRDTGAYGFVEAATQFTAGLIGASKLLKPVKALDATVKGLGVSRRAMVAGAAADMVVFDPYEERLSNLIAQSPAPLASDLAGFLAADEDDPIVLARLKAGLEGTMTGAAVDKLIHGIRAMRAARRQKAGTLAPETARDRVQQELAAAEARAPKPEDGPAVVKVDENGTPTVSLRDDVSAVDAVSLPVHSVRTVEQAERLAASINYAARNAELPAGTLTDEQRTAVLEVKRRIAGGTDPGDVRALHDGLDFNFKVVEGAPEDAKALINAMSEVMGHDTQLYPFRQRDGFGQSHAETMRQAAASISDMDPDAFIEGMRRTFGDTDELPRQITAARWYFHQLAKKTAELSRVADLDPSNPVAAKNLADALDTLFKAHEWLSGTTANVARSLDAHKIDVTKLDVQDALSAPKPASGATADKAASEGLTPEAVRALARTLALVGDEVDPKDVLTLIKGAKRHAEQNPKQPRSWVDWMLSYRTEMLLSGPKTHAVNGTSNIVTAFQVPLEHWWAGVRSGNAALRRRGADELAGMVEFQNVLEALKAAGKVFKTGEARLDPSNMTIDGPMANAPQWLGWTKYLVPSRLLATSDEFFKTMTYRSAVRAQSLRLSREMGITDGAEIGRRLVEDLRMSINAEGAAVNPKALEQARYATFTNDLAFPEPYKQGRLGMGNLGESMQEAANKVPILRLAQPFIRTPVNIFRFTGLCVFFCSFAGSAQLS